MLRKIKEIILAGIIKSKHLVFLAFGSLAYFFILSLVFYICLWGFINVYGKDILLSNLYNSLGVKAQLDSVSLSFPLSVKIKNLKCKDVKLGDVKVSLGGYNVFNSRITIDKIYVDGLHLKIRYLKDKFLFEPIFVKNVPQKKGNKALVKSGLKDRNIFKKIISFIYRNKLSFNLRNLYVKNWTGEIIDQRQNKPIHFLVSDGEVNLKDFYYPELSKYRININASLETNNKKAINKLSAKGWIDCKNKDMDLDVNIFNIDYWAFIDYYPKALKPETLELKDAMVTFRSNLSAYNNNLVVNSRISLERIEFIKNQKAQEYISGKLNIFKKIVSLLPHYKNKPTYKFTIKTKMDSPSFDFSVLKDDFVKKIKTPKAIKK